MPAACQAGRPALAPCTPAGVIEILKRSNIPIAGQHAVVVGRSDIVGKPAAMLLLHQNATVTICHSKTRDLPSVTREADILVAAIGRPGFITPEMVKPGATLIDVGINRITTREEFERFFAGDAKRAPHLRQARLRHRRRHPPHGLRTRRRLHARPRRRRPAHHRHADVQHRPRRQNCGEGSEPMLRVGLTGGSAAAKAPLPACFASSARTSSKSDEIGRELMQPGQPVYAADRPSIRPRKSSTPDGHLDRSRLAQIAFRGGRLKELNAIVHPAVIDAQKQWMDSVFARDPSAVAVIESALIFEAVRDARARGERETVLSELRRRIDRIIVVTAPDDLKIPRYVARLGLRPRARGRRSRCPLPPLPPDPRRRKGSPRRLRFRKYGR